MRAFFMALVLATGLGVTSAKAQSVVIDDENTAYEVESTTVVPYDDDDDVDTVVVPRSGTVVVERRRQIYRPPVYGWVQVRPDNCGTFKYWDGEQCLDARYYPPPGD